MFLYFVLPSDEAWGTKITQNSIIKTEHVRVYDSVSHFSVEQRTSLLKKSLICELWESYFTRFLGHTMFFDLWFCKKKKNHFLSSESTCFFPHVWPEFLPNLDYAKK